MKVTPLVQIFLDGRAFKAESAACEEEKRSGEKVMKTLVFFCGGCWECGTRRSYSLDRIHVHDSYFLFPFQNNFFAGIFREFLFAGKFLWPTIYLLANDPHCNLSFQSALN